MQAAAEQERTLAAAAALARQQLEVAGTGQQQGQLAHVVQLTQEVAQQSARLQQAVQQQQEQLTQQQVGCAVTVGWQLKEARVWGGGDVRCRSCV
jgi:S-adenosylmethionine synthetase